MQTYEVPEGEWMGFFDRFSRDHSGWPVTIEVLDEEAGPQRLVQEQPLQGISIDSAGSRPCTVQIGSGDNPDANFSHSVDLPLHIRVADNEQGSDGTLEIEPARGPVTLVRYRRPGA
jgi:hypothetical protein